MRSPMTKGLPLILSKCFNRAVFRQHSARICLAKVTDDTGRSSVWTRYRPNYDVPPTRPTADADKTDPPEKGYHVLECETLTVDGSQSSDPDDEDLVRHYRWDLSYDGDTFNTEVAAEDENGDGTEAVSEVDVDRLVELGHDDDGNGGCSASGTMHSAR